jgi:hypothetical protein
MCDSKVTGAWCSHFAATSTCAIVDIFILVTVVHQMLEEET